MSLDAKELVHHILPSTVGGSIMLSMGEHILTSIGVSVAVWLITHGLAALHKAVKNAKDRK